MKRPWRPHYTMDWHGSPFVRSLDLQTRMIYLELLDIEWDEGGLENEWFISPFQFLCRRIGCHWRTMRFAWGLLEPRFELQDDSKRRSRRVQEELKKASGISEERSKAALLRWSRNTIAMPSQSQSQSQHKVLKSIAQPAADAFDFSAVYAAYPLKRGKTIGLKRCCSQIKTQARYDELVKAVANYANDRVGKDKEFIKHFSTFMNSWQDWIAPEGSNGGAVQSDWLAAHNARAAEKHK